MSDRALAVDSLKSEEKRANFGPLLLRALIGGVVAQNTRDTLEGLRARSERGRILAALAGAESAAEAATIAGPMRHTRVPIILRSGSPGNLTGADVPLGFDDGMVRMASAGEVVSPEKLAAGTPIFANMRRWAASKGSGAAAATAGRVVHAPHPAPHGGLPTGVFPKTSPMQNQNLLHGPPSNSQHALQGASGYAPTTTANLPKFDNIFPNAARKPQVGAPRSSEVTQSMPAAPLAAKHKPVIFGQEHMGQTGQMAKPFGAITPPAKPPATAPAGTYEKPVASAKPVVAPAAPSKQPSYGKTPSPEMTQTGTGPSSAGAVKTPTPSSQPSMTPLSIPPNTPVPAGALKPPTPPPAALGATPPTGTSPAPAPQALVPPPAPLPQKTPASLPPPSPLPQKAPQPPAALHTPPEAHTNPAERALPKVQVAPQPTTPTQSPTPAAAPQPASAGAVVPPHASSAYRQPAPQAPAEAKPLIPGETRATGTPASPAQKQLTDHLSELRDKHGIDVDKHPEMREALNGFEKMPKEHQTKAMDALSDVKKIRDKYEPEAWAAAMKDPKEREKILGGAKDTFLEKMGINPEKAKSGDKSVLERLSNLGMGDIMKTVSVLGLGYMAMKTLQGAGQVLGSEPGGTMNYGYGQTPLAGNINQYGNPVY